MGATFVSVSWGEGRVVVALLVALAVAVGCASESSERLVAPTTTAPAAARYRMGDCVDFDRPSDTPTSGAGPHVVDCDAPHLFQVSVQRTVPDSPGRFYPTPETWERQIDVVCRPGAATLLGKAYDPYGAFALQAIRPTRAAWADGDRTIWCGLGRAGGWDWIHQDARTADQTPLYKIGGCFHRDPESDRSPSVACTSPHELEVTGRVVYTDGEEAEATTPPAGRAVIPRCQLVTEQYLGGPVPPPWVVIRGVIQPASWDAGRRVTHCMVAQVSDDGEDYRTVTGSIRG
jgi:Septum formation